MLRKAKDRVRGPQKQRFRPPPQAPRPGSNPTGKVKFSSIADAFEAVLDGTDEFSNPLFDYDSGEQQQESVLQSAAKTSGGSSWQYVEHPPSNPEAAGKKAVQGKPSGSGLENSEDLDRSVDPLLGRIVSKPHSVTSNSSSLLGEDNKGEGTDSAAGYPHSQPLGAVVSESSSVTSGFLFDEDERAEETISTVDQCHQNQVLDEITSGPSSATSLFDEDNYEKEADPEVTHHQNMGVLESEEPVTFNPDNSDLQSTHDQFTSDPETQTIGPQEDPLGAIESSDKQRHQNQVLDEITSGPSSATSLFDEDNYEKEADPEVTHHQNEGVLESEEPVTFHPDDSDLQSTHDQFTSEPKSQTVGPQEDPLGAIESSDKQRRIEEQGKTRTSSDELLGNEGATFTAPAKELKACELSSSPSSMNEQSTEYGLEEQTLRTSVADETKVSLHPRQSETKIIVTCNDLDASELVHPLRASSPEYHTDTILLEGDPETCTSKSSSEEPEEGGLEAGSRLKPQDHVFLQESPLSSLPSSCESGENFLARNPLEHPVATPTSSSTAMPELPRDADIRSPSVESGIGSSVEIPLPKPRPGNDHVLLFDASEHPLSPNTSYEEGFPHEESTTRPQEQRDPLDSFVKIDKNDLFPLEEDHFAKDSSVKETSYSTGRTTFLNQSSKPSRPAVPSRPSRPPTKPSRLNPPLPKRNSAGKIPPPRPSYSPKLQHRKAAASKTPPAVQETAVDSCSSQESRSNGTAVKVKLVQPLGCAPPSRVGKSPLPSHAKSDQLFTATSSEAGPLVKDSEPSCSRTSRSSSAPDATSFVKQQASLTARSHSLIKADVPKPSFPTKSIPKPENTASTEVAAGVVKSDQKEDVLFDEDEEGFLPGLSIEYILLLAGILYLYFSLNVFTYVSGFLAGLLLFYVMAGAAFIYYVHNMEEGSSRDSLSPQPQLSDEFVRSMKVDFDKLRVYQSNAFTATFQYDSATHHPSDRSPAKVKLSEDFTFTIQVFYQQQQSHPPIREQFDIRDSGVSLVPLEVAQNRKRRWSKKFPIKVSWSSQRKHYSAYLFAPTSRDKEDWFRRLRAAEEGVTSNQLISRQREFFSYMQGYFPTGSVRGSSSRSAAPGRGRSNSKDPHRQGRAHRHKPMSSSLVQFSNRPESEEETGAISITKASPQKKGPYHATGATAKRSLSSISSVGSDFGTSVDLPPQSHVRATTTRPSLQQRIPSVDEDGYVVVPREDGYMVVPRAPKETDWINALVARLCWDIWHEERWKTWVMTRIQRKLIRMKTPSFMEKLQLTGVELGNNMPVINRLRKGPTLDLRGVWAYLDVTYRGLFVMTIETKLKFGGKDGEEETGTEMVPVQHSHNSHSHPRSGSPNHSSVPKAPSHSRAAKALALGTPVDPEDIDSGSDDEGHPPVQYNEPEEPHLQGIPPSHPGDSSHDHSPQQQQQQTSRKGRLMNVVSRFTKKVANTRIMRKAAEKVSSYPLVLRVEVKELDGVLAVNIPPPPSDTIWYGFEGTPDLKLVAKPKLGRREVTLTQVTHWIEKKLCELVKKKLVLPNMEDLVIPLLNSGLPEDKLTSLTSPTTPKEHSSY